MYEGFMPIIGKHYDRIRIEKDKVSRDAEYFKDVIERGDRRSCSCRLIESTSSITIWYDTDEHSTVNLIKHLIANGISFQYDFTEFSIRHAMYIENYDYSNEENISA